MKSLAHQLGERVLTSHPSRGAWIEISISAFIKRAISRSHPSRGAWIEILAISVEGEALGSVAPLAGCVD